MKNQLFALIGLGLLLATASAYAQTGVVKANVPFNFIVNKTDLPAGAIHDPAYGHHRQRDGDPEPGQQSRQGVLAECLPVAAGARRPPSWFSTATARQYFLAQIWTAGNDRGQELPKSGREREVRDGLPGPEMLS